MGSWFSNNNAKYPEISNGYPLIRDSETSARLVQVGWTDPLTNRGSHANLTVTDQL